MKTAIYSIISVVCLCGCGYFGARTGRLASIGSTDFLIAFGLWIVAIPFGTAAILSLMPGDD